MLVFVKLIRDNDEQSVTDGRLVIQPLAMNGQGFRFEIQIEYDSQNTNILNKKN